MSHISLDTSNVHPFIKESEIDDLQSNINRFHQIELNNKTAFKNNSLGWIDHPISYDVDEFEKIKQSAKKVRDNSDILLVIGIGGSYLGARAAIEMLTHSFHNLLSKEQRVSPKVLFVGQNLCPEYISDLIDLLKDKDFSINVISKSGSTIEPMIAFRIFRRLLIKKYGEEESKKRVYVTTDKRIGALRTIATIEGYETFDIPENIGGRYSVLTTVGLFPIATSGICIEELLKGAAMARLELSSPDLTKNKAYEYAAFRNALYKVDKVNEILVSFDPSFHYFSEWWKQLFAESEGKDEKGIFPASATYSTDLHSIGQYIQEGRKSIFETIIKVAKPKKDFLIEKEVYDFDDLNYLSGKSIDFVNNQAFGGTILAHTSGGIPNIVIKIPDKTAFTLGYLFYFFQKSCAMSAYILGVNPFDQPGVEAYKKNMLSLLNQPNIIKDIVKLGQ